MISGSALSSAAEAREREALLLASSSRLCIREFIRGSLRRI